MDQRGDCLDAIDPQHSAVQTPLGVLYFKLIEVAQMKVGMSGWGWGHPSAQHPAESEIPEESPLPVTAPTAF